MHPNYLVQRLKFNFENINELETKESNLSQAIEMSSDNLLLTAWDHRAACYEKLQQYQPALKDAKRMIDLKPECSKVSIMPSIQFSI